MRFELTRRAAAAIDEIIRYTDEHFGAAQTDEYLRGLYEVFESLRENPGLGREWDMGKRCMVFRLHLVFYRVAPDRIIVTDVRNARQRPPTV